MTTSKKMSMDRRNQTVYISSTLPVADYFDSWRTETRAQEVVSKTRDLRLLRSQNNLTRALRGSVNVSSCRLLLSLLEQAGKLIFLFRSWQSLTDYESLLFIFLSSIEHKGLYVLGRAVLEEQENTLFFWSL